MNNLEEKLNKIKVRGITQDDKHSLWHNIMVRRVNEVRRGSRLLSFSVFRYSMNKLIVGVLALVLILGGGSMVAASNEAVPGDLLFPVDLAIEKLQLKFAGEDGKLELKLKFAEERVEEIKHVSEEKSTPAVLVTDLSAVEVSEIEAEVFTNETIVKIEAGDKKYGYVSALKIQAELVKEIASKYSLTEEKVNTLIDFSVEDRASQADDKGFLNKTHSVNFSEDESEDVGTALTNLEELLEGNEENAKAQEIEQALKELLILLGDDGDLEIRKKDGEIKIKSESFKIEIKTEKGEDSDDDKDDDKEVKDDDKDDDSDDSDDDKPDGAVRSGDTKEDDDEVFCRGEWRDLEDCDDDADNDSDDEDDDKDEDSKVEDSDDSDDDDDKDDDKDEDEDDDNSGSGSSDSDDDEDDN